MQKLGNMQQTEIQFDMDNPHFKKVKLKIHGMHCASCEVLIERKFKKISGVETVQVNHHNGKAELICSTNIDINELNGMVNGDGYSVSFEPAMPEHKRGEDNHHSVIGTETYKNTKKDYFRMGGTLLIIVSAYYILKKLNILPTIAISEHMSYGVVFLIGLFAAVSTCVAVVGGLLLAVAEKLNESHPGLNGIQKFKPHIYFNTGRVVGYTGFGAAVGSLGSIITLSPQLNGYLTLLISIVMLLLGFQLLHLFPWLMRFSPKMPKFISHKIYDLSDKESKGTPFVLGAATFFLPCGFTQALQLYVLASGDWKVGALTMFVFSLGTLPALISLSAITSFTKGAFQQHLLKFAGVLVVSLAIFNVNNGLALTGSNLNLGSIFKSNNNVTEIDSTPTSQIVEGKQIIDMEVVGLDYSPHQFTVMQGVPVEWRINGSRAQGCAQVIVVPKLGITKYLSPGATTVINFTPQEIGSIGFSCTMGMTTRNSAFNVIPNTTGIVSPTKNSSTCNPEFANCI
jgi:sulfite exporter TauE/SafE/copper chaperone CopZ